MKQLFLTFFLSVLSVATATEIQVNHFNPTSTVSVGTWSAQLFHDPVEDIYVAKLNCSGVRNGEEGSQFNGFWRLRDESTPTAKKNIAGNDISLSLNKTTRKLTIKKGLDTLVDWNLSAHEIVSREAPAYNLGEKVIFSFPIKLNSAEQINDQYKIALRRIDLDRPLRLIVNGENFDLAIDGGTKDGFPTFSNAQWKVSWDESMKLWSVTSLNDSTIFSQESLTGTYRDQSGDSAASIYLLDDANESIQSDLSFQLQNAPLDPSGEEFAIFEYTFTEGIDGVKQYLGFIDSDQEIVEVIEENNVSAIKNINYSVEAPADIAVLNISHLNWSIGKKSTMAFNSGNVSIQAAMTATGQVSILFDTDLDQIGSIPSDQLKGFITLTKAPGSGYVYSRDTIWGALEIDSPENISSISFRIDGAEIFSINSSAGQTQEVVEGNSIAVGFEIKNESLNSCRNFNITSITDSNDPDDNLNVQQYSPVRVDEKIYPFYEAEIPNITQQATITTTANANLDGNAPETSLDNNIATPFTSTISPLERNISISDLKFLDGASLGGFRLISSEIQLAGSIYSDSKSIILELKESNITNAVGFYELSNSPNTSDYYSSEMPIFGPGHYFRVIGNTLSLMNGTTIISSSNIGRQQKASTNEKITNNELRLLQFNLNSDKQITEEFVTEVLVNPPSQIKASPTYHWPINEGSGNPTSTSGSFFTNNATWVRRNNRWALQIKHGQKLYTEHTRSQYSMDNNPVSVAIEFAVNEKSLPLSTTVPLNPIFGRGDVTITVDNGYPAIMVYRSGTWQSNSEWQSNINIADGKKHQLVLVNDYGTAKLYIDGFLSLDNIDVSGVNFRPDDQIFYTSSREAYLEADLYDFKIYEKALTQGEIQSTLPNAVTSTESRIHRFRHTKGLKGLTRCVLPWYPNYKDSANISITAAVSSSITESNNLDNSATISIEYESAADKDGDTLNLGIKDELITDWQQSNINTFNIGDKAYSTQVYKSLSADIASIHIREDQRTWLGSAEVIIDKTKVQSTNNEFIGLIKISDPVIISAAGVEATDIRLSSMDGSKNYPFMIDAYSATEILLWARIPLIKDKNSSNAQSVLLSFGSDQDSASHDIFQNYNSVHLFSGSLEGESTEGMTSTDDQSFTNGRVGSGLIASSSTSEIIPDNSSLYSGTISLDIKAAANNNFKLYSSGSSTPGNISIHYNAGDETFVAVLETTNASIVSTFNSPVQTGVWKHIDVTYNVANQRVKIFIDGEEGSPVSLSTGTNYINATLGYYGTNAFVGEIDNFRTISAEFTSENIKTAFANISEPQTFFNIQSPTAPLAPQASNLDGYITLPLSNNKGYQELIIDGEIYVISIDQEKLSITKDKNELTQKNLVFDQNNKSWAALTSEVLTGQLRDKTSIATQIYKNDGVIHSSTKDINITLTAPQIFHVVFPFSPDDSAQYRIDSQINAPENPSESTYSDNSASATMDYIRPVPDLAISLSSSTNTATTNDTAIITARVQNIGDAKSETMTIGFAIDGTPLESIFRPNTNYDSAILFNDGASFLDLSNEPHEPTVIGGAKSTYDGMGGETLHIAAGSEIQYDLQDPTLLQAITTFEFDFSTQGSASEQTILSRWDKNNLQVRDRSYQISYSDTTGIKFSRWNETSEVSVSTGTSLARVGSKHVAVVFNESNIKIFIDGQIAANGTIESIEIPTQSTPFKIGHTDNATSFSIDNLAITHQEKYTGSQIPKAIIDQQSLLPGESRYFSARALLATYSEGDELVVTGTVSNSEDQQSENNTDSVSISITATPATGIDLAIDLVEHHQLDITPDKPKDINYVDVTISNKGTEVANDIHVRFEGSGASFELANDIKANFVPNYLVRRRYRDTGVGYLKISDIYKAPNFPHAPDFIDTFLFTYGTASAENYPTVYKASGLLTATKGEGFYSLTLNDSRREQLYISPNKGQKNLQKLTSSSAYFLAGESRYFEWICGSSSGTQLKVKFPGVTTHQTNWNTQYPGMYGFKDDLELNNTDIGGIDIDSLEPGQSHTFRVHVPLELLEENSISVTIDPDNKQQEISEDNNTLTTSIIPTPTAIVDVSNLQLNEYIPIVTKSHRSHTSSNRQRFYLSLFYSPRTKNMIAHIDPIDSDWVIKLAAGSHIMAFNPSTGGYSFSQNGYDNRNRASVDQRFMNYFLSVDYSPDGLVTTRVETSTKGYTTVTQEATISKAVKESNLSVGIFNPAAVNVLSMDIENVTGAPLGNNNIALIRNGVSEGFNRFYSSANSYAGASATADKGYFTSREPGEKSTAVIYLQPSADDPADSISLGMDLGSFHEDKDNKLEENFPIGSTKEPFAITDLNLSDWIQVWYRRIDYSSGHVDIRVFYNKKEQRMVFTSGDASYQYKYYYNFQNLSSEEMIFNGSGWSLSHFMDITHTADFIFTFEAGLDGSIKMRGNGNSWLTIDDTMSILPSAIKISQDGEIPHLNKAVAAVEIKNNTDQNFNSRSPAGGISDGEIRVDLKNQSGSHLTSGSKYYGNIPAKSARLYFIPFNPSLCEEEVYSRAYHYQNSSNYYELGTSDNKEVKVPAPIISVVGEPQKERYELVLNGSTKFRAASYHFENPSKKLVYIWKRNSTNEFYLAVTDEGATAAIAYQMVKKASGYYELTLKDWNGQEQIWQLRENALYLYYRTLSRYGYWSTSSAAYTFGSQNISGNAQDSKTTYSLDFEFENLPGDKIYEASMSLDGNEVVRAKSTIGQEFLIGNGAIITIANIEASAPSHATTISINENQILPELDFSDNSSTATIGFNLPPRSNLEVVDIDSNYNSHNYTGYWHQIPILNATISTSELLYNSSKDILVLSSKKNLNYGYGDISAVMRRDPTNNLLAGHRGSYHSKMLFSHDGTTISVRRNGSNTVTHTRRDNLYISADKGSDPRRDSKTVVIIKNTGQEDILNDFDVELKHNGRVYQTRHRGNILAGEEAALVFNLEPMIKSTKNSIEVNLDTSNEISESDENNKATKVTFNDFDLEHEPESLSFGKYHFRGETSIGTINADVEIFTSIENESYAKINIKSGDRKTQRSYALARQNNNTSTADIRVNDDHSLATGEIIVDWINQTVTIKLKNSPTEAESSYSNNIAISPIQNSSGNSDEKVISFLVSNEGTAAISLYRADIMVGLSSRSKEYNDWLFPGESVRIFERFDLSHKHVGDKIQIEASVNAISNIDSNSDNNKRSQSITLSSEATDIEISTNLAVDKYSHIGKALTQSGPLALSAEVFYDPANDNVVAVLSPSSGNNETWINGGIATARLSKSNESSYSGIIHFGSQSYIISFDSDGILINNSTRNQQLTKQAGFLSIEDMGSSEVHPTAIPVKQEKTIFSWTIINNGQAALRGIESSLNLEGEILKINELSDIHPGQSCEVIFISDTMSTSPGDKALAILESLPIRHLISEEDLDNNTRTENIAFVSDKILDLECGEFEINRFLPIGSGTISHGDLTISANVYSDINNNITAKLSFDGTDIRLGNTPSQLNGFINIPTEEVATIPHTELSIEFNNDQLSFMLPGEALGTIPLTPLADVEFNQTDVVSPGSTAYISAKIENTTTNQTGPFPVNIYSASNSTPAVMTREKHISASISKGIAQSRKLEGNEKIYIVAEITPTDLTPAPSNESLVINWISTNEHSFEEEEFNTNNNHSGPLAFLYSTDPDSDVSNEVELVSSKIGRILNFGNYPIDYNGLNITQLRLSKNNDTIYANIEAVGTDGDVAAEDINGNHAFTNLQDRQVLSLLDGKFEIEIDQLNQLIIKINQLPISSATLDDFLENHFEIGDTITITADTQSTLSIEDVPWQLIESDSKAIIAHGSFNLTKGANTTELSGTVQPHNIGLFNTELVISPPLDSNALNNSIVSGYISIYDSADTNLTILEDESTQWDFVRNFSINSENSVFYGDIIRRDSGIAIMNLVAQGSTNSLPSCRILTGSWQLNPIGDGFFASRLINGTRIRISLNSSYDVNITIGDEEFSQANTGEMDARAINIAAFKISLTGNIAIKPTAISWTYKSSDRVIDEHINRSSILPEQDFFIARNINIENEQPTTVIAQINHPRIIKENDYADNIAEVTITPKDKEVDQDLSITKIVTPKQFYYLGLSELNENSNLVYAKVWEATSSQQAIIQLLPTRLASSQDYINSISGFHDLRKTTENHIYLSEQFDLDGNSISVRLDKALGNIKVSVNNLEIFTLDIPTEKKSPTNKVYVNEQQVVGVLVSAKEEPSETLKVNLAHNGISLGTFEQASLPASRQIEFLINWTPVDIGPINLTATIDQPSSGDLETSNNTLTSNIQVINNALDIQSSIGSINDFIILGKIDEVESLMNINIHLLYQFSSDKYCVLINNSGLDKDNEAASKANGIYWLSSTSDPYTLHNVEKFPKQEYIRLNKTKNELSFFNGNNTIYAKCIPTSMINHKGINIPLYGDGVVSLDIVNNGREYNYSKVVYSIADGEDISLEFNNTIKAGASVTVPLIVSGTTGEGIHTISSAIKDKNGDIASSNISTITIENDFNLLPISADANSIHYIGSINATYDKWALYYDYSRDDLIVQLYGVYQISLPKATFRIPRIGKPLTGSFETTLWLDHQELTFRVNIHDKTTYYLYTKYGNVRQAGGSNFKKIEDIDPSISGNLHSDKTNYFLLESMYEGTPPLRDTQAKLSIESSEMASATTGVPVSKDQSVVSVVSSSSGTWPAGEVNFHWLIDSNSDIQELDESDNEFGFSATAIEDKIPETASPDFEMQAIEVNTFTKIAALPRTSVSMINYQGASYARTFDYSAKLYRHTESEEMVLVAYAEGNTYDSFHQMNGAVVFTKLNDSSWIGERSAGSNYKWTYHLTLSTSGEYILQVLYDHINFTKRLEATLKPTASIDPENPIDPEKKNNVIAVKYMANSRSNSWNVIPRAVIKVDDLEIAREYKTHDYWYNKEHRWFIADFHTENYPLGATVSISGNIEISDFDNSNNSIDPITAYIIASGNIEAINGTRGYQYLGNISHNITADPEEISADFFISHDRQSVVCEFEYTYSGITTRSSLPMDSQNGVFTLRWKRPDKNYYNSIILRGAGDIYSARFFGSQNVDSNGNSHDRWAKSATLSIPKYIQVGNEFLALSEQNSGRDVYKNNDASKVLYLWKEGATNSSYLVTANGTFLGPSPRAREGYFGAFLVSEITDQSILEAANLSSQYTRADFSINFESSTTVNSPELGQGKEFNKHWGKEVLSVMFQPGAQANKDGFTVGASSDLAETSLTDNTVTFNPITTDSSVTQLVGPSSISLGDELELTATIYSPTGDLGLTYLAYIGETPIGANIHDELNPGSESTILAGETKTLKVSITVSEEVLTRISVSGKISLELSSPNDNDVSNNTKDISVNPTGRNLVLESLSVNQYYEVFNKSTNHYFNSLKLWYSPTEDRLIARVTTNTGSGTWENNYTGFTYLEYNPHNDNWVGANSGEWSSFTITVSQAGVVSFDAQYAYSNYDYTFHKDYTLNIRPSELLETLPEANASKVVISGEYRREGVDPLGYETFSSGATYNGLLEEDSFKLLDNVSMATGEGSSPFAMTINLSSAPRDTDLTIIVGLDKDNELSETNEADNAAGVIVNIPSDEPKADLVANSIERNRFAPLGLSTNSSGQNADAWMDITTKNVLMRMQGGLLETGIDISIPSGFITLKETDGQWLASQVLDSNSGSIMLDIILDGTGALSITATRPSDSALAQPAMSNLMSPTDAKSGVYLESEEETISLRYQLSGETNKVFETTFKSNLQNYLDFTKSESENSVINSAEYATVGEDNFVLFSEIIDPRLTRSITADMDVKNAIVESQEMNNKVSTFFANSHDNVFPEIKSVELHNSIYLGHVSLNYMKGIMYYLADEDAMVFYCSSLSSGATPTMVAIGRKPQGKDYYLIEVTSTHNSYTYSMRVLEDGTLTVVRTSATNIYRNYLRPIEQLPNLPVIESGGIADNYYTNNYICMVKLSKENEGHTETGHVKINIDGSITDRYYLSGLPFGETLFIPVPISKKSDGEITNVTAEIVNSPQVPVMASFTWQDRVSDTDLFIESDSIEFNKLEKIKLGDDGELFGNYYTAKGSLYRHKDSGKLFVKSWNNYNSNLHQFHRRSLFGLYPLIDDGNISYVDINHEYGEFSSFRVIVDRAKKSVSTYSTYLYRDASYQWHHRKTLPLLGNLSKTTQPIHEFNFDSSIHDSGSEAADMSGANIVAGGGISGSYVNSDTQISLDADFSTAGNFSISWWNKILNKPTQLITVGNDDITISSEADGMIKLISEGTETIFSAPIKYNKWNAFTLIKNGESLTLVVNGVINDFNIVTSINSNSITFNESEGSQYSLDDLKVFDYAIEHSYAQEISQRYSTETTQLIGKIINPSSKYAWESSLRTSDAITNSELALNYLAPIDPYSERYFLVEFDSSNKNDIILEVDSANQVVEIDETNNQLLIKRTQTNDSASVHIDHLSFAIKTSIPGASTPIPMTYLLGDGGFMNITFSEDGGRHMTATLNILDENNDLYDLNGLELNSSYVSNGIDQTSLGAALYGNGWNIELELETQDGLPISSSSDLWFSMVLYDDSFGFFDFDDAVVAATWNEVTQGQAATENYLITSSDIGESNSSVGAYFTITNPSSIATGAFSIAIEVTGQETVIIEDIEGIEGGESKSYFHLISVNPTLPEETIYSVKITADSTNSLPYQDEVREIEETFTVLKDLPINIMPGQISKNIDYLGEYTTSIYGTNSNIQLWYASGEFSYMMKISAPTTTAIDYAGTVRMDISGPNLAIGQITKEGLESLSFELNKLTSTLTIYDSSGQVHNSISISFDPQIATSYWAEVLLSGPAQQRFTCSLESSSDDLGEEINLAWSIPKGTHKRFIFPFNVDSTTDNTTSPLTLTVDTLEDISEVDEFDNSQVISLP